jgi:site-specific recombinase XerD
LLRISETPFMLLEIFKEHNKQMAALVNKQYAPNTLRRYVTVLRILQEFLQWKFQVKDLDIKDIDHSFITSLDFYLRSVRNCNNNSTCKYIRNFKKIILSCVAHGWLAKDPFLNYKAKLEDVERDFLSEEELAMLSAKQFTIHRLTEVRDVFLFCCYTGLSYADVKNLKHSEISTGIDGYKWIFTNREKTEEASRIPLLPVPLELMKKYKNHPACENRGLVLPVISNQKMNAYLQEIKELCSINKQLTCHIARHTFATTVTLSNGVPMETVSKMLGHKSVRTTQIYAKVIDKKVSTDMTLLRSKLEGNSI